MTDIIERQWGGAFLDWGGTGWYGATHPNAGLVIDGTNERDTWAALEADKAYRLPPGTGPSLVSSNVTVTVLALAPAPGFLLKPAAGVTVTIHGQISAGRWQWIDVSAGGTVLLPDVPEVFPEWWGAVGDNSTPSADAVEAAFATGRTVTGDPSLRYRLERGIVTPVGTPHIRKLRLRPDATIPEESAIQNTVAIKAATTLTTAALRVGERTIDVASTDDMAAGDILTLQSDELWPFSNQGIIYKGETTVIKAVLSGTQLELALPLMCSYVTASEDVAVKAYEPYELDIDGLDIEFPALTEKSACAFYNFKDGMAKGLRFKNCGHVGGSFGESVDVVIESPQLIENFKTGLGYGIQWIGCTNCYVDGGFGYRNRHAVDTSGDWPSHGCGARDMTVIARPDEGSCLSGHGSSNGTTYTGGICIGGIIGVAQEGPNSKTSGITFLGCIYPVAVGAPGFTVTDNHVPKEPRASGITVNSINQAFLTIQLGDGTVVESDFWVPGMQNTVRGNKGNCLDQIIDIHEDIAELKYTTIDDNDFVLENGGADQSFIRSNHATPLVVHSSCRIGSGQIRQASASPYVRLRNMTWANPGIGTTTVNAAADAEVGHIGQAGYTSVPNTKVFTFTMAPAGGCLFTIADGSSAKGGLFYADYVTAAITIVSDPSSYFQNSSTPGAGKVGVYKSANSDVISIKNGVGSTRSLGICVLGASVSAVTAPA